MESRLNIDGDRVETLEKQLREARDLAAESDRRFEEVMLMRQHTHSYFTFTIFMNNLKIKIFISYLETKR